MMDTEKLAGLALGVTVDQQNPATHPGEGVGEVHRRGGLADAAFGHGHGDFTHGMHTDGKR
jgi:hypothetical protein